MKLMKSWSISAILTFQDHGWTIANGSLDYSLFYNDLLQLIEKGNVKLSKSITSTLTLKYNHINYMIQSY